MSGDPRSTHTDGAIQAALKKALALHRQGQLQQAELLYADILRQQPEEFDALHLLGVLAVQTRRTEFGVQLLQHAIAINPRQASAHFNLGNALRNLKRVEDAIASYDRAIACKPEHAEAHRNRGILLAELKRPADALASYEAVVRLQPDHAEAYNDIGNALCALDRREEAIASYDRAIALKPDFAEAYSNRANALRDVRRIDDAVASYDTAIALRPDLAEAYSNRANALLDLRRLDEAIASCDKAIALKPDYAEAHNNRGNALSAQKEHQAAVVSYEKAIALTPSYAEAYSNLGNAQVQLKQHQAAAASYAKLLEINPDFKYALGRKLFAQLQSCDWTDYAETVEQILAAVRRGKAVIFPGSFLSISQSPSDQLACASHYVSDEYPPAVSLWNGERYRHDKIRIAYLSADFHEHATAYLMAELFEIHDRDRFEVSAYSFSPTAKSEMRNRLERAFHRFNDVSGKSDEEIARMLREQEIDIAVDLKGFTHDSRFGIFAHRPSPVQVNYLAFPGTIGTGYMDYIIGDPTVTPAAHDAFYSENVVRLPHTYQVNDGKRTIAERTPTRAELGLPDSGFVFCCFNNNYKITPDVLDVWMHLLGRVEGSVLWLLEDNPEAAKNLRREAGKRGVAAERLVFARRMALPHHLARHRLADLFLDTLPYNAHTTASDALWAGLPVLTCIGTAFAGRVAASLLKAIGLPELITESMAAYEARAVELATTPRLLADIKAKVEANRATYPLFDADRFRRHIESAYIAMHERYQNGLPPQSFSVAAVS